MFDQNRFLEFVFFFFKTFTKKTPSTFPFPVPHWNITVKDYIKLYRSLKHSFVMWNEKIEFFWCRFLFPSVGVYCYGCWTYSYLWHGFPQRLILKLWHCWCDLNTLKPYSVVQETLCFSFKSQRLLISGWELFVKLTFQETSSDLHLLSIALLNLFICSVSPFSSQLRCLRHFSIPLMCHGQLKTRKKPNEVILTQKRHRNTS